ncbi:hypothetical protein AMR42_07280 [Limnothrix sp. PR1529]|nr:hypothetical protein BCR12_01715 [Limnothrix sp. P13C2]PIB14127.1 hypothetical protein AMR42_07280 [Limnothrix sp. PR1529]
MARENPEPLGAFFEGAGRSGGDGIAQPRWHGDRSPRQLGEWNRGTVAIAPLAKGFRNLAIAQGI